MGSGTVPKLTRISRAGEWRGARAGSRWLGPDAYGGNQEGPAAVTRAKAFRQFFADMKS